MAFTSYLETGKQIVYLNVLRVIAITGVLITHVFMTTCAYWTPILNENEVYFCTVLRNMWHWCVPVLVMISGVLFLNPEKELPVSKMITKYVLKMILALILLAIPAEIALQYVAYDYQFAPQQILTATLNIIQGRTQTHLWYLYLIIGLYLITPLLRAFTRYTTKKEYEYILVILFIFTSVLSTIKKIWRLDFGINIPVNSAYVFYFLLGFYIHQNKITLPPKIPLMVIICFVLYTTFAALKKSLINPLMDNMLRTSDKDSPIVALTATAIFIFFSAKFKNFHYFNKLAPLCFGIYLIHPFYIYVFYLLLGWTPDKHSLPLFLLVIIPTTFMLSIGTSYLGILLIKAVKYKRSIYK
jgi:surface polysaccharide O-acyltransferase-like enzyme